MVSILVQHEVRDFKEWKKVFDAHLKFRKDSGELSSELYVSPKNPNDVTVFCKWDSLEKAEKFLKSDGLKEAMQNSGVTSKPYVLFLKKV